MYINMGRHCKCTRRPDKRSSSGYNWVCSHQSPFVSILPSLAPSPGGLICPLLRYTLHTVLSTQYTLLHSEHITHSTHSTQCYTIANLGEYPLPAVEGKWRASRRDLGSPHERIRGERIRSRQTNNEQPTSPNKEIWPQMITWETQHCQIRRFGLRW